MKKNSQRLLILSIATFAIFLVNKLIFSFSTIKEQLHNGRAHYYQWKFGKIHYTVQGKGPSVLLVHDTTADSSSFEFNRIINALSKQYRVYTLDLIGYGKSDKPKITYTAYLFVQLLIDFRKDIIKEKTSVISSGKSNAYITMACYQDPDLFKNLIFINPSSLHYLTKNPRRKNKLYKLIIESPLIGTSIYNFVFSKHLIRKSYLSKIFNPSNIKLSYINACNEAAHLGGSASKFTYASDKCRYNNVNITEAIRKINNSISIIQGSNSDNSTEAIALDYTSINQAIETAIIERTKTHPHIEKPESTLEMISIFLN